jgi:hypothetical protein
MIYDRARTLRVLNLVEKLQESRDDVIGLRKCKLFYKSISMSVEQRTNGTYDRYTFSILLQMA